MTVRAIQALYSDSALACHSSLFLCPVIAHCFCIYNCILPLYLASAPVLSFVLCVCYLYYAANLGLSLGYSMTSACLLCYSVASTAWLETIATCIKTWGKQSLVGLLPLEVNVENCSNSSVMNSSPVPSERVLQASPDSSRSLECQTGKRWVEDHC